MTKYHEDADKADLTEIFSSLCAIIRTDDYVFDEKYKDKGLTYFECSLDDRFQAILMKMNQVCEEDAMLAK